MDDDRPIKTRAEDRLGFGSVAEKLAKAILDQSAKEGLVFGIEGKWGSGKSTLINLTIEALKSADKTRPEIIAYSPWLVGNRSELLGALFDELATAATKIDPVESDTPEEGSLVEKLLAKYKGNDHQQLKRKQQFKETIGKGLKVFGRIASGVGGAVKVAGEAGLPGGGFAGNALGAAGESIKSFGDESSISRRKAELVAALKLLSRPIVVFVDDLDRLDPREVSEVLRLIRAVADFPNIIYVLSFDPVVVAQTLTKAVQIDDGKAFLEKIVQVSFRVPKPDAFDLRRWFESELEGIFNFSLDVHNENQREIRQRLSYVVDVYGGRYLKTPRDVIRALNLLRLQGKPIQEFVDVPDLVWLQLIRASDGDFYNWIEDYVIELAAVAGGAMIAEHQANQVVRTLCEIIAANRLDPDRTIMDLQEVIPGLNNNSDFSEESKNWRSFHNISAKALAKFIRGKRLASPYHYRYYFSLSEPAGAFNDENLDLFLDRTSSDVEAALAMFSASIEHNRPQGGVMAEVLLNRIEAIVDTLKIEAIPAILLCFGNFLDHENLSRRDSNFFGTPRSWPQAERLTRALLLRLSSEDRFAVIKDMFISGRAIGWLTSLFRGEIFAHGHYGDRSTREEEWLFTDVEFRCVLDIILERYREASFEEIVSAAQLISLLFGWGQASKFEEVREWVKSHISDDTKFLRFLSRARGWVSSTDKGVYYPLKKSELNYFLDFDQAVSRLNVMAVDTNLPVSDRGLAKALLVAASQGESD